MHSTAFPRDPLRSRIDLPVTAGRAAPTDPPVGVVVSSIVGVVVVETVRRSDVLTTASTLVGFLVWLAVGIAADRVYRHVVWRRRERQRFVAELERVEADVSRARAEQTAELSRWYPTSHRDPVREFATQALVLGRGRANSRIDLHGRPEEDLAPDDPVQERLARLRAVAARLDDAPLCVPLGSRVTVEGPEVLAESVAVGLRRQMVRAGCELAEATRSIRSGDASAGAEADTGTTVQIDADGSAFVTRLDGRACRVPLEVSYVSRVLA